MRCIAAMVPSVLQNMPSSGSISFRNHSRQMESRHNRMTKNNIMAGMSQMVAIATSLPSIYGAHTGLNLRHIFQVRSLGGTCTELQLFFPKSRIPVYLPVTPLIYDRCLPKAKNTHDP